MKWKGRRKSTNVEDRRGMSGGKAVKGGSIVGVIVVVIYMFISGNTDPEILNNINQQLQQNVVTTEQTDTELSAHDIEMGDFVKTVLADTEDVWNKIFREQGLTYKEPKLVLFRNSVQSGCGGASSASGPFYCPADQKVYMDLAFFDELESKFGAKGGDFAIAYVIAHEIGHHVQTLLGTSSEVRRIQSQVSEKEGNKLSVALELQADFYAGLWVHYNEEMNSVLEEGDIEEALSAAHAVGDDAIQKRMQGHVVPDSFTHGTSAQRMYWFKKGLQSGDINQGDTFKELTR